MRLNRFDEIFPMSRQGCLVHVFQCVSGFFLFFASSACNLRGQEVYFKYRDINQLIANFSGEWVLLVPDGGSKAELGTPAILSQLKLKQGKLIKVNEMAMAGIQQWSASKQEVCAALLAPNATIKVFPCRGYVDQIEQEILVELDRSYKSSDLDAFLRNHPNRLDALMLKYAGLIQEIDEFYGVNVAEGLNGTLGHVQVEIIWRRLIEVLKCIGEVEDYDRFCWINHKTTTYTSSKQREAPAFALPHLIEFIEKVEKALSKDPENSGYWSVWGQLLKYCPRRNVDGFISQVIVPPSTKWPNLPMVRAAFNVYRGRRDWERVVKLADLMVGLQSESGTHDSGVLEVGLLWKLDALLRIDREQDVASCLKEIREISGSAWPQNARNGIVVVLGKRTMPAAWHAILQQAPVKSMSPAPRETPRDETIAILYITSDKHNKPSILINTEREPFCYFSNTELVIRNVQISEFEKIVQKHNVAETPDWIFIVGNSLVKCGKIIEFENQLPSLLVQHYANDLIRLNAFVAKHPENILARKKRFELIMEKMPNSRLEVLAISDVRYGLFNLPLRGTFNPQSPVLLHDSEGIIKKLEKRLNHMPNDGFLWLLMVQLESLSGARGYFSRLFQQMEPLPILGEFSSVPKWALPMVCQKLQADGRHEDVQMILGKHLAYLESNTFRMEGRPINVVLKDFKDTFWPIYKASLAARNKTDRIRMLEMEFGIS